MPFVMKTNAYIVQKPAKKSATPVLQALQTQPTEPELCCDTMSAIG